MLFNTYLIPTKPNVFSVKPICELKLCVAVRSHTDAINFKLIHIQLEDAKQRDSLGFRK